MYVYIGLKNLKKIITEYYGVILDRPILVSYPDGIMHDTSHAKGKASTAKQTCLGSLLGLELN